MPNTSGAYTETVPDAMTAPTEGALTSNTNLHVEWTALTDGTSASGGSTTAITSYNLQWDQGINTWADLQGASPYSTATSYQTTSITAGTTYKVRVRARNKYGWGSYSAETSITPALAPSAPSSVTTTQSGTSVNIAWTQPTTNGLTVTQYEILIKKKDGTFASASTCVGTDSSVITSRSCSVTMLTLRNTFNLVLNDLVVAKVRAYNAKGWSTYSSENVSGATIKTEPAAPTALIQNGALTDDT